MDRTRDRDGLPDPVHRTLEKRERLSRDEVEARPVRWPRGEPAVDPEVFQRNLDRHVPEEGLDERMLWALASAKINRGERYGVELSLEKAGPSAIHPDTRNSRNSTTPASSRTPWRPWASRCPCRRHDGL